MNFEQMADSDKPDLTFYLLSCGLANSNSKRRWMLTFGRHKSQFSEAAGRRTSILRCRHNT